MLFFTWDDESEKGGIFKVHIKIDHFKIVTFKSQGQGKNTTIVKLKKNYFKQHSFCTNSIKISPYSISVVRH